jgi:hypothetical protein
MKVNDEFLFVCSSQFYTIISYWIVHVNNATISSSCINPSLIQIFDQQCDVSRRYLAQTPMGSTPSYIDLNGDYLQTDVDNANIDELLASALNHLKIHATG